MKKCLYLLFLGALMMSSCSNDSLEKTVINGDDDPKPSVTKVLSVFTNGTNMSVGTSSAQRSTGTLTVGEGESESTCAKYDVAAGFQSKGTVPYIKVSIHVYEDCASECDKLSLTFKNVDGLLCKADDFAIRSTDGTYLDGCYGTDAEGNKISEYKYGNLSVSGDLDIVIGGLDNLVKTNKAGGDEEPVINTFEVWIWPQNTEDHTWTLAELNALANSHDVLKSVKETPTDTHPGKDMGDIIWAEDNVEGYYAWGEIFTAPTVDSPGDAETASFTHDGTTYTNDASYYPFAAQGGKTYYNYNHYRYFDNTNKMTKYQWNADHTSQDGKTRLEATDDVATMRWGNGWRMPTSAEMDDLLNGPNTTAVVGTTTVRRYNSTTGTYSNVEVRAFLITSNITNNTIALPATGYYGKNENNSTNASCIIKDINGNAKLSAGCYYWTSDLSSQAHNARDYNGNYGGYIWGAGVSRQWCEESLAWMCFDYYQMNGYDRCFGMKVRPVKDK